MSYSKGKRLSAASTAPSGDSDVVSNEVSEEEFEAGCEVQPAGDVTVYNAYNMGPAFGKKFPLPNIRIMVSKLMKEKLANKSYSQPDALKWARDLADEVNMRMRGKNSCPRYKHVVNVMLYQQTGAGCFYAARAIWDHLADDYMSCTFDGGSFVCIVTVFGCYQY
ncbi:hypothetical protein KR009_008899 [Drosophila setifemur]|nr:hypothetical protein KR009_008899 [Drosophila setifemur]